MSNLTETKPTSHLKAYQQFGWLDDISSTLDIEYPHTYLLLVDKKVEGSFPTYLKAVSTGLVRGLEPNEFIIYPTK